MIVPLKKSTLPLQAVHRNIHIVVQPHKELLPVEQYTSKCIQCIFSVLFNSAVICGEYTVSVTDK